jgi:hypothetical protein
MMKKTGIIVLAFLLCVLSACNFTVTKNSNTDRKSKKTEAESKATDEQTGTDQENDKFGSVSASADNTGAADRALIGEWIVAVWTSYSGKPDDLISDMEYSTYMADDEYNESTISIYEDNGALYADFSKSQYESNITGYHLPVEIVNEALYPECENQDWYAEIINPKDRETILKIALLSENKLINYDEYSEEDAEYPWKSVSIYTYLREGSEDYANRDDLKYNNTVTVSNAEELFNAIGNNTKIILEEGVYDFNDLKRDTKSTKYAELTSDMDGNRIITLRDVSYLALVAEDGAKAEICVETPYDPVLRFSGCYYVAMDGITLGHHVEPGTCGGSVLSVDSGSCFEIRNCHLYGCGAYGIETDSSSSIDLIDTEIYECTYGIAALSGSYEVNFKNCSMHDNKEYEMIWASDSSNVSFDDCTFTDNSSTDAYSSDFISLQNECYDFTFRNCTFTGNTYAQFCAQDIEIDNCTFNDRVSGRIN